MTHRSDPLAACEARCMDAGCFENEHCRRWLDRHDGCNASTLRLASLFPYDIPLGSACPLRIPIESGTSDDAQRAVAL